MGNDLLTHQLQGKDGEVVLLLNGGMMTHGSWAPVAEELLDDEYRVLGCDFRGQLMSPGDGHRRLEGNVDDLVALLDTLELETVHVLGTSFGGLVSVLLTALHPSRVHTLAVVTAVDRTPEGMAEDAHELQTLAREVVATGDPSAFQDALIAEVYSPEFRKIHAEELAARRQQLLPEIWYRGLEGILESIASFDLSGQLDKIRCPTLIVRAARDAVFPAERVNALADGIADAELRVHPTSGHALVSEDPAWLVKTYRDFLVHAA